MNSNLQLTKEVFLIKLKSIKEYPTNMYLGLLISFTMVFTGLILSYVLYASFKDIVPWSFKEFIFYLFYILFIAHLLFSFYIRSNLAITLLSGQFNTYLVRPRKVFFQYFIMEAGIVGLLNTIPYFVILSVFLFLYDFIISRLLITIIYTFISSILIILIYHFLNSLGFFIKNINNFKESLMSQSIFFNRFPAVHFIEKFPYLYLLFPQIYFGGFILNYLFGYATLTLVTQMLFKIIILEIVLVLGIYSVWHYGLKKYEAFG